MDGDSALLTDFYQLTMLQAYWRESMHEEAVFSLFVRRLPAQRNYLLACGLDTILEYLENLAFSAGDLECLSHHDQFSGGFLDWLAGLRFTGDVFALAEGTPFFAGEPVLEVVAPLPEAQLAETFLLNQIHVQTLLASKAARVVHAARGRAVVDFGLRRSQGADAGIKGARAFHIAGVEATSNVLAGRLYGIPVTGTMAHSYIQAHDDEMEAFRAFAELYPGTILLVDTYSTLEGVRGVARLAREMDAKTRPGGVRLDSGDLGRLSVEARKILDEAGLEDVQIFASGGLDEHAIAALLDGGAPLDGFGVGTAMSVSSDAPALDLAYKLTAYAGRGRTKLSPGKPVLPGRKQVFRIEEKGQAVRDILARSNEGVDGRPLLRQVMEKGARTSGGEVGLDEARENARAEIARLPVRVRKLDPARPLYRVEASAALAAYHDATVASMERFRS